MITSAGLLRRLAGEIGFLANRCRAVWPELKREPAEALRREGTLLYSQFKRVFVGPHITATATALAIVSAAVVLVTVLGRNRDTAGDGSEWLNLDDVVMVPFELAAPPEGSGVGVGSHGRVGLATGKGEGSNIGGKQSRGGGGSGDNDPKPVRQGKVQQP